MAQIPDLKNALIDAIIDKSSDEWTIPSREVIRLIWTWTIPDSPLRRLFLPIAASANPPDCFITQPGEEPLPVECYEDYIVYLHKYFVRSAKEEKIDCYAEWAGINRCDFHEH